MAGYATHLHLNAIVLFVLSAAALVLVVMVMGHATDQLGKKLGVTATGILQSALGNLPELFICIFALKAGLDDMVKATLIGSILGNSLLVFGLTILLGGLKNGRQKFPSEPPKMNSILMLLAFATMAIPTLAYLHIPAEKQIDKLDIMVALVLIGVFVASLIYSIKGEALAPAVNSLEDAEVGSEHDNQSMPVTIAVLTGAALVSDWFVEALKLAMDMMGINEVFADLIMVVIAGNGIENLVGIQLALKNKSDYAFNVILNGSLQIALIVFPVLVLVSFFLGGVVLSFVVIPMLLIAYALTVLYCV